MNRRKAFFISFLSILLIASSAADVAMHRQEAAPNPQMTFLSLNIYRGAI